MVSFDKILGLMCRKTRIEHGYTLKEVATEINYSQPNISLFEHGQNRNYIILLWYIDHGLTSDAIKKIIRQYEKKGGTVWVKR